LIQNQVIPRVLGYHFDQNQIERSNDTSSQTRLSSFGNYPCISFWLWIKRNSY